MCRRWHCHRDADALYRAVADEIIALADAAIAARGEFVIVLAGGSTPVAVYRLLARAGADWPRWRIYFGDERCVPVGDSERNDAMARRAWLDAVAIPDHQIHPIPAELGPATGAQHYRETVTNVDRFDLVLLGLGEDGHTASLFPGHDPGCDPAVSVLAVIDAPKPPPRRVSLSASRLSRTRHAFLLATGAAKRRALQQLRRGGDIPALAISPAGGLDVHTDLHID